jgi:hypothetical protein
MSFASLDWSNKYRSGEMLLGVFAAWAGGKDAKMKDGSDWKTLTPDTLKVKSLDGSWVSLREAIAAYDRKQETDGPGDS